MKMSEKSVNVVRIAVVMVVAVLMLTFSVKAHAADPLAWDKVYQNYQKVLMTSKAQEYESATNDLILIDEAQYTCAVFCKLQDGGWYLTKTIPIAIGKASTPTPCGEYTIKKKFQSFDLNGYRFWYVSWFGGFGIHSTAYQIDEEPYKEADASISKKASNGCIRMNVWDAKWISDNVSKGTKVVIYDSAY